MNLYRIGDCNYINDLSGRGAALYGGRWNSKDTYILYTAQSPSLALLEAVVHLGKLPAKGYCMITIDVPDGNVHRIAANDLPPNWFASPGSDFLKKIGDDFIRSGKYLALALPSVIIPEECNYLLNPAHKLFRAITVTSQTPVRIDERIFKAIA
jgi:RES domain-containing protein